MVIDQFGLSKQIQLARSAICRFAPIVKSDLSPGWAVVIEGSPCWNEFCRLTSSVDDARRSAEVAEIEYMLGSLNEFLDLLGKEPMGSANYPFKAAELIESYCRMVTGEPPDTAPVGLAEWVDRPVDVNTTD